MEDRTVNEEAGLPDNWIPVDSAPIVPGATTAVPSNQQSGPGPYFVGSIPSNLQHDTTFVRTGYQTQGVAVTPLMPLAVSGIPSSNAAVQTIVKSSSTTLVSTAGGVDGDIQYNSGGAFAGVNIVPLAHGGTGNDLSGSGGSGPDHFVKQSSAGSPLTVSPISTANLSAAIFGPSGVGHSIGVVPDPGAVAGSSRVLCEDGTWKAVGGATPAVAAFYSATLPMDVVIPTTTAYSIISIPITFPSSGGPWRVIVNYSAYCVNSSISETSNMWVNDGTDSMAGSQESGYYTGGGPVRYGHSSGQMSPNSYGDGASITFQLYVYTDHQISVTQNPFNSIGVTLPTNMTISVVSSA